MEKKRKREKTKIYKIRSKKEVRADNVENQRILKDCYKELYANKLNNLEEMDKFSEKYNLPKLNQEEI